MADADADASCGPPAGLRALARRSREGLQAAARSMSAPRGPLPPYWRALGAGFDEARREHQFETMRNKTRRKMGTGEGGDGGGGEEEGSGYYVDGDSDPSVAWSLGSPEALVCAVRINPRAFFIALAILWSFIVWCLVDGERAADQFSYWKQWITETFTWFFMLIVNVFVLFLLFVAVHPRYGKLVLGPPNDAPEFNFITWLCMLFTTGVGIGLFFFGSAEPIWHYAGPNRYAFVDQGTSNQRAQWAINLSLFHWGLHAWAIYGVLGLAVGVSSHSKGLPLTFKSCLYPLMGDLTFSWIGDFIDGLTATTTVFGVCTSLGLGVMQINAGFNDLFGWKEDINTQVAILWVVTAIATLSVVSGLHFGIRRLSEVCFALGVFIVTCVFFLGDSWFYLNLIVQSIGFYFQWIVELGFWTDAFEQLGDAPDGTPDRLVEGTFASGPTSWMNSWTVFYMAWWISWAPFVGMFIARISKGRTVREYVAGALVAPLTFEILWFCVFGGTALKMERAAENAGLTCEDPKRGDLVRLSCGSSTDIFFDVLGQWGGFGSKFLAAISIISLVLYFVTSSDSGSLIVDKLTSNGDRMSPIPQRIFWAVTEGATATALLVSGGSRALNALQASSICAGLPFGILMCLLIPSTLTVMEELSHERKHLTAFTEKLEMLTEQQSEEEGGSAAFPDTPRDVPVPDKHWTHHALAPLVVFPGHGKALLASLGKGMLAVFAPWWACGNVAATVFGHSSTAWKIWLACLFYLWPALLLVSLGAPGTWSAAWAIYLGFATTMAALRVCLRLDSSRPIEGFVLTDFAWSLLGFPLVAHQMQAELAARHSGTPSARRSPSAAKERCTQLAAVNAAP